MRQWKREGCVLDKDSALWLGDHKVATVVSGQDGSWFLYPHMYEDQARTFNSESEARSHADRQLDLWLLQAEVKVV